MKLSLSMMIVGILALLAATTGAQEAPVSPAGESQADPAEGPVIEAFPEDEEQSTPEATASEEAPAPPVEEPPPSATPPVETTPPEALQEARERVARATTLFDLNNYDAALVEFQRAYEILGEHPNRYLILYNIAQCHEMRFRYDEALRLYREYLFHGGLEADDRVPVETHIRELEALLATVRVRANAPNAEIFVDGRSIGTAPIAVGIAGGIRTIEVRAPGYISERRQVQLPAGGEEILEFTLEQLSEEFGGIHQAYFWTTVGLSAATLIAGVVLGVQAISLHNEVRNQFEDDFEQWFVNPDDVNRISDYALTADILFGATALFAVGALVFGLLTNWDDEEDGGEGPNLEVSFLGGPNAAGLLIGGRL